MNLLETWEALSAAEAEKAAEDAKLFKNKVKDTAIKTEEVETTHSDCILKDFKSKFHQGCEERGPLALNMQPSVLCLQFCLKYAVFCFLCLHF